MCMSFETEQAARNWIAERLRVAKQYELSDHRWYQASMNMARSEVLTFQRHFNWLRDYDLTTCTRKPKPVRKPPIYREGMKVVREAIREAKKLPAEVEHVDPKRVKQSA